MNLPYRICWDKIASDLSEFEFVINCGEANEEKNIVKLKYNYDEKVNKTINSYLESSLKGKTKFEVSDLELVSYWLYNEGDSNVVLALYSGELKRLLDYKNIQLFADGRAGSDDRFGSSNMGYGTFQNNGIIYKIVPKLVAFAEHVIYIDEAVGNSKDEVVKAVQKRLDDYFGTGKIRVEFSGEGAYNSSVSEFDTNISNYQNEYN